MTRVGAWLMAAVLSAAGLTAVLPEASADPVIEHGTALPAIPDGHVVSSVAISGDFVYAALRATPASVETPTILYRTTADGSGAWSPVIDPDTDQPLQASAFRVDGSAVVVLDSQPGEPPCDSYRIIEGGAARSFTSCSFPVVGDGGLIARRDEGNAWLIEDHDGFLVDTAETQPALDGSQVWTYDAGLITGFDTASKTALPDRTSPLGCADEAVDDVADGYALVRCSYADRFAVIDVRGDLPPWPLTGDYWKLGAGFAAEPSSIGDVQVAHVVDLGQGKAEHWFQGSSFAVDRRSPRIVLRVSATALEVADLSLAPRASTPDDITPPTISPVTGPASLILDDMLADYYFHGTDPDHPDAVSYQIREAWPAHGASPVWGAPVSASSPFTVHIRAGQTLCLQARTRDWAGNVSAWTGPPCTYVDGQAPVTSMTTRPPRDLLADTPVTLQYRGIEDDVLVSYDLASQIALPGQRWGSWTIQPTTATSATRRVPAGAEQCFLVRARDRVGHVGAYTANDWCVRMPYDDRALVGHRGARRLANAYALGHTVTRIAGRASLTHRGIRARTIDIRVIGQALYQCPRITVGDMRVDLHTCTRTRQGRHIWYHYYFPHDRVGTLRIRPSLRATHGQRIDAVAIGR